MELPPSCQSSPRRRALTVPVCVCWLIYNAVNRSLAGVCNETFTLISIAVAFFRYDRKKPPEEKEKEKAL